MLGRQIDDDFALADLPLGWLVTDGAVPSMDSREALHANGHDLKRLD